MSDNSETSSVEAPDASPVDLGAVAEDSTGVLITAAQLLAGTSPGNQSLFSQTSVPDLVSVDEHESVELGLRFTASVDGSISGIRFYKSAENTGPHVANLWACDGTLLATATFTNETPSGWQEVIFSAPVAIAAGQTYIASYHTSGHYSADYDYFDDPITDGHLSTPDDAGVYAYGNQSSFPQDTYRASNYWVDVVFNAPLSITALTLTSGNGTLVDNHDGTWTYSPAADDDSAASFSYTASDGSFSASSTASLDITPVNDAPTASPVELGSVAEDDSRLITAAQLLAGVGDIDGPAATITALSLTSGNGTLVDNHDGTWTYNPAADDDSAASFSYTASDGSFSASSTASLDITPVNDAPAGVNGSIAAIEDTSRVLAAADFAFSDVEGNALSGIVISTLPGAGLLTLDGTAVTAGQFVSAAEIAAGKLSFKAAPDANGDNYTSFAFQVVDDGGTAHGGVDTDPVPNTLTVNVAPVNDAPTAVTLANVRTALAEDTSTAARVKIADIGITDIDGGPNGLSLSGLDSSLFEIVGSTLYLKAGARLDFETKPLLSVNVDVNDPTVGGAVDARVSLTIKVGDVMETVNGAQGADTLAGANYAEKLNGLGGNDRISGNSGDDRISGGAGRDIMTGGLGRDVFVFTAIGDSAPGQSGLVNSNSYGALAGQGLRDIITDFAPGVDKIDLSAIDANIRVAGNQAFSWHGTGNLAVGRPGQLIERIYNAPGTANDKTVIYGDVSGDGRADFQIELSGLKALTAADFVL